MVRIQSECGEIRTRKTPNTETFHAVNDSTVIFQLQTLRKDTRIWVFSDQYFPVRGKNGSGETLILAYFTY